MQIKEMHVYGYGKLENQHFTNLTELYVFFGENEAGKSTIMSFLHSMLFGFPTKVQTEQRYEPKMHAKYGGMLILQTKRFGEVRIERVKGKATGDVTVTYENGKTGNEEELKNLVYGIDKAYFQSIFSFDLQGLQGLHTLSEGEIGKYLLSAGLVGNDKIVEAEASLQKELEQRFKPSGQKPILNVKMTQLKELKQQLKVAGDEQQAYNGIQEEKKELAQELTGLAESIQSNEEQLFYYQEFLRIKPLAQDRNMLEQRLEQLGDTYFPIDGLKRLEQLLSPHIQLEAQLAAMKEKKQEFISNRENLKIHSYIEEKEEQIDADIESAVLIEKLDIDCSKLEQMIESNIKEIDAIKTELALGGSLEAILQVDTSTFAKEKVRKLEQEKQSLHNRREQLDERYRTVKASLEQSESRMKELKLRRLPAEQKQRLEEANRNAQQGNYQEVKKELLDEQIADLEIKCKEKAKKARSHKVRNQSIILLVTIFLIGLATYSFINDQLFFALFFGFLAIIVVASPLFMKKEDIIIEWKRQLVEAKRKLAEIEAQVADRRFNENESVLHLLEQEKEIEKLLANETFKFEEREQVFDSIILEFEEWEAAWKRIEDKCLEIVNGWGLQPTAAEYNMVSVFDRMSELKTLLKEKNETNHQILFLKTELDQRKAVLIHHAKQLEAFPSKWQEALIFLKRALNDAVEKSIKIKQQLLEEGKIASDWERITAEKTFIEEEVLTLYRQAEVKNEEGFRQKSALVEEREQLKGKRELLMIQLNQSRIKQDQLAAYFEEDISSYSIENLELKRKELAKRQSQLLEKQSDIKHRLQQLEEGGNYDKRMHNFYEERASFNEEAKEWATFALAKSVLHKTIERFKTERLPEIMAKAENYFSFLTDGEYTKISMNQTGDGFYVQRRDQVSFNVSEVSRGTAEQLYMSLRFALANSTFSEDPFPLIIDDSFVNFDRKRTANTLALLKQLSNQRQVIFFTCHEHLLTHFSVDQVKYLSKPETLSLN